MIYFRGCTAREKESNISDATEKLLRLADVEYTVLDDEKCCGSVLLRTGFFDEAQKQIKKNAEIFGNELILTSCAGCYKTLKSDYENVDGAPKNRPRPWHPCAKGAVTRSSRD